MRILGISGSLRRGSYNTALLRHASDVFEAEGAEFEIHDELRSIPPFDEDQEQNEPPAVAQLRAAVAAADAVFFATPRVQLVDPRRVGRTRSTGSRAHRLRTRCATSRSP